MSNSIKAPAFNPFNDKLGADQRLRLIDGELTVEDSTVRSSASAWSRFWSRGQYSQTAILKKMTKLYKGAQKQIGKDEKRDNFVKNFATLEYRATAQNELFKDTNSIARFFKAKSFIDVASFHDKFDTVDKTVVQAADQKLQAEAQAAEKKIQDEAKAAQKKLDEQVAAQQKLDQKNLRKAQAEAAKQAQEEQRIAEREARVQPYRDNKAKYTKELEELENCPLDVFLKGELARLVDVEKWDPIEAQEALDDYGQMEYDRKIRSLKTQISSADTMINALSI